jgi:hypothetical protein
MRHGAWLEHPWAHARIMLSEFPCGSLKDLRQP